MHVGKFWGPGQPRVPIRHQKDADVETERRGRGRLSGTGRRGGGMAAARMETGLSVTRVPPSERTAARAGAGQRGREA